MYTQSQETTASKEDVVGECVRKGVTWEVSQSRTEKWISAAAAVLECEGLDDDDEVGVFVLDLLLLLGWAFVVDEEEKVWMLAARFCKRSFCT